MIARFEDFDEIATVLATALRKTRAAEDKVVRTAARQSGFAEACKGSPTLIYGALLVITRMLEDPAVQAQAYEEGLAGIEAARRIAGPATTPQVKSSLIALGSEPDPKLKQELDNHGFERVSAPEAKPVHFVGTADVTLLRPLVKLVHGTINTYKAPAAPVGRGPQSDALTEAIVQTAIPDNMAAEPDQSWSEDVHAAFTVIPASSEDHEPSDKEKIVAGTLDSLVEDTPVAEASAAPSLPDAPSAGPRPEERAAEAMNLQVPPFRAAMVGPTSLRNRPIPKAVQEAFAPALDSLDLYSVNVVREADDPAYQDGELPTSRTKEGSA